MSINVEACTTDGVTVLDVLPSPAKSNQLTSTKQSAGKFKMDVIVVTATISIVIGLFQFLSFISTFLL